MLKLARSRARLLLELKPVILSPKNMTEKHQNIPKLVTGEDYFTLAVKSRSMCIFKI